MNIASHFRRPMLVCSAALVLMLSTVLGLDALYVMRSSDAELLTSFRGAAYEDVFGLGFWPTWAVLAVIEVAAAAGVYWMAGVSPLRHVVAAMLVAFVIAGVLGYAAHSREHALWEAYVEQRP